MTLICQVLTGTFFGIIGAFLICCLMAAASGILFFLGGVYHYAADYIKEKFHERRKGRAGAR